ncbi:MAG: anti-sigma factor [Pseudomonadota bacterium]
MTQNEANTIGTDLLHAYVDNQLDRKDRTRVETHLRDNPEAAADVAAWQRQNESMRELFADAPSQEGIAAARAALSAPDKAGMVSLSPHPAWRMAAAVTLFIAGAALGFGLRPTVLPSQEMPLLQLAINDAFSAHRVYAADPHRPVELRANEEELLVNWLSRRIGTPLAAPNLSGQGYDLVGGRLLSGDDGPAALFMYEGAAGDRVTVFVSTDRIEEFASFRFEARDDGLQAAHWTEDELQFAVVGPVDRDTIRAMAIAVYEQII